MPGDQGGRERAGRRRNRGVAVSRSLEQGMVRRVWIVGAERKCFVVEEASDQH